MARKATIYDVSKLAATSATTVSRVLNQVDYPVTQELRNAVIAAAKQLGYSPNLVAKTLKRSDSRDIGVVIPTISNMFYASMVLSIEKEVSRHGYNIILCNTFRDPKKEQDYVQFLYEKQVRGVILSPIGGVDIQHYLQRGMHFVFLDQMLDGVQCKSASVDTYTGAKLAVEYLIAQQHRRVAFISSPLTRWTRTRNYEGYVDALACNGLELRQEDLFICGEHEEEIDDNFEFVNGRNQAYAFLQSHSDCTAAMCVNDMTAFGFIQGLHSIGIRVPEDVSVIGMDDVMLARMFSPALTTIRYPTSKTGELAANIIVNEISGDENDAIQSDFHQELILRNTVRALP